MTRLSLSLILLAGSCCSAPRISRLETCIPDMENKLMHCPTAAELWTKPGDWVCHRIDQWKLYFGEDLP